MRGRRDHNLMAGAQRTRRFLLLRSWRLWFVVFDLLALGILFAVHRWPLLKVREVVVVGPESWQARAQQSVTIPSDSNLFGVDRSGIERCLNQEFAALAENRVKLTLSGRMVIRLTPNPVALWTEGSTGIGTGGELLLQPIDDRIVPVWRASARDGSHGYRFGAIAAAAAWAEVIKADRRWRAAVSEWRCDPKHGWEMTGSDGQTRIILGWDAIESRAYDVARLLAQPDSVLKRPCTIDARFDRYLIVRPRPEGERIS